MAGHRWRPWLLLGMVALLWWTAPALARADVGEAHTVRQGWSVATATARRDVGKLRLEYDPALESEAQWLAREAPQWWSEVERALAVDLDDTLHVTFVAHAGRIAEATGMPRWAGGVASPAQGTIVISLHGPDGSRADLRSLLKHEMAHVALHRATAGAALPRWFHEGVAESFEGGISLRRAETLAGAVFGPGVPDLRRLERLFRSDDPQDAAVAYAAARDLVTYLRARGDVRGGGHDGAAFRQWLAQMHAGYAFDAAFVRAYGVAPAELVQQWREGLFARFVWFPLVASGGLPLALVAPLIALAWARRRRVLAAAWSRIAADDARLHAQAWARAVATGQVHAGEGGLGWAGAGPAVVVGRG